MVCLQGHWEADLNTKVRKRVCVCVCFHKKAACRSPKSLHGCLTEAHSNQTQRPAAKDRTDSGCKGIKMSWQQLCGEILRAIFFRKMNVKQLVINLLLDN